MILVIDNYDSFTYNVVQYLGELGSETDVVRNDQISVAEIVERAPEKIVLSPGPCTPNEAGICVDLLGELDGSIPLLGICLGHQCIGQAFGGRVVRAHDVMHGKTSTIQHDQSELFGKLSVGFTATRYHSLVVERSSLPACLTMSAWTETADGNVDEVMGLRHVDMPIFGVQFHPESILTEHGHQLLQNFLNVEAV